MHVFVCTYPYDLPFGSEISVPIVLHHDRMTVLTRENWCAKIRAYSICLLICAFVYLMSDSERASSSKDTVLYNMPVHDCANCKGA